MTPAVYYIHTYVHSTHKDYLGWLIVILFMEIFRKNKY